jgi:hypothetical protein
MAEGNCGREVKRDGLLDPEAYPHASPTPRHTAERPTGTGSGMPVPHLSPYLKERMMPAITKQRVNVKSSARKHGRQITAKKPVVKLEKFVGYDGSESGAWI